MKREIKRLKAYFSQRQDIIFAFLFGSQAEKIAGKISDWDIAVYFRPQKHSLEWEETECRYPEEDKVWSDLVSLFKTDNVDLIVLNRAPANIAASALSGIPLVIKERGLFLDFMLITMRQAEDYGQFVDDYYEVSQRSLSLLPKDKQKLKKIVNFLEQEMALYNYFSGFSFQDYNDVHKRHDIERWLENILNCSIDIGEIILASEKKKIPDYYREVFSLLGLMSQFKGIDFKKFETWVKLRNILAHEYLDIKWKRIEEFIKDSQPHLTLFLEKVKKFL